MTRHDNGGYLVNIETGQSGNIKKLFDCLSVILGDVNITFDKNGIKILTMDGTKVVLIHMRIMADKLETYYCKRTFTTGINLSGVHKLLKVASDSDVIALRIFERDPHKLHIILSNQEKYLTTKFVISLLDIDEDDLDVDDLESDVKLTMSSSDWQRTCRDMSNLSDYMTIRYEENKLSLSCEGDNATWNTEISNVENGVNGANGMDSMQDGTVVQGRYSLKFLCIFAKSTGLSSDVELRLQSGETYLIVQYCVSTLGTLQFVLESTVDDDCMLPDQ